ncbi:MAG: hypothetical protein COB35_07410 [Gammaproteobacteria bacterium]|nr:MAG: hypothetical protein COB35_07410 [Gammaproteobacteria bacterium]
MKISILVVSLSFCTLIFSSLSFSKDTAGKTIVARGKVDANYQQDIRPLKRRSPIFKLDTINTGENSNTQLRMIDGGLLSLQQETQLIVNNYQYNQQTHDGSVSLNLLKGGLRTVTGALKKGQNRYQMQTPVASIGVRGTHYEAELVKNDLYLSVWDGAIDVQVTVGSAPVKFSLGKSENYNYAIVHANGEVELTLKVPAVFAQGHSETIPAQQIADIAEISIQEQQIKNKYPDRYIGDPHDDANNDEFDQSGNTLIDNNNLWGPLTPVTPEIIAARSGTVVFDNIIEHSITSSAGAISDLSMSMSVNFDTGRVPTGQLSFNDANGQWFAVFNGIIASSALEININFASYNNELVEGSINGILLNNGSQVFGDFSLSEINNSANHSGGGFLLTETP